MLNVYLPETNILKTPLTILVKASRNSSSDENVTRSPSVSEKNNNMKINYVPTMWYFLFSFHFQDFFSTKY